MKNKLYYVLLSLIVSFSFINAVFAAEFSYTISASADKSTVVKGEEATIKLSLKSDSAIAGCLFKVDADSTLEYVSKSGANGWNVTSEGTEGFLVENSSLSNEPLTNGKNILEFKYKVNGDGKVTIKTDYCVTTSTDEQSTHGDVVVELKSQDLSEDTTLSNISVTGGQISNFDPTVYTGYTVKLDSPNFSLNLTASNPDYQDDIVVTDVNGNTLDPSNITFSDESGQGLMIINITVNGKTTYMLAANYEQTELDNSLASLTINGKEVVLESGKYEYEVKIDSSATKLDVQAILKDSNNFQFASGNAPGEYNISGDSTSFALIIEPKSSQSGAKSVTYTIEVVKEETVSSSSSSKSSSASSSSSTGGNVSSNPSTGGISMFIMAFILISSLVGSIFLYQKNLESYK